MNKKQISLDISQYLNTVMLSNLQVDEINKIRKKSIVFDYKRILIYASIIGVLQFFVINNPVNNLLFLTGATTLINNSLFPELIGSIAIISEMIAKLLAGTLLNKIHTSLFNKTKKYNDEKELVEDMLDKAIEEDIVTFKLNIYDKILSNLEKNKKISEYSDIIKYKTLKVEDVEINKKMEDLKMLLIKRRMIGEYIEALSCKNNKNKDTEYTKLRFLGYIFWLIQYIISSNYLGMLGFKSNLLLNIITYVALAIGSSKVISYRNSTILDVISERKIAIDGFCMSEDLELLKMQFSKNNQEIKNILKEITDLYYDYCIKQIAIEDGSDVDLDSNKNKRPISRGIAPIDRGLETEPVVVKSRILRREDNV